mmetsp:Transcript_2205/g.6539  ORF Transcript_2205/g.6539 Transcript_2205/m.6539 type:complete len:259 (+) Transcript_2205:1289-2065(+)
MAASSAPSSAAPRGRPHACAPCASPASSPAAGKKHTRPSYVRSRKMRHRPYTVSRAPPIQRSTSDSMSTSDMSPHVELSTARIGRPPFWPRCRSASRSAATVAPRAAAKAAFSGVHARPAPSSRLIATALPLPPGMTATGTPEPSGSPFSTSCRMPSPPTTTTMSCAAPRLALPRPRATSVACPCRSVKTTVASTPARSSVSATLRRYTRSACPLPLAGLTSTSAVRARCVPKMAPSRSAGRQRATRQLTEAPGEMKA